MQKLTPILMAIALAALAALYVYLELTVPLKGPFHSEMLEIRKGTNFKQATELLMARNLVRDPIVFMALGKLSGLDTKLVPGRYTFTTGTRPIDVYRALRQGLTIPWKVTLIEGQTLSDIKVKLAREDLVSKEDFDRLARDSAFLARHNISAPSLEGYLFPDTYLITKGLKAEAVLGIMIRRMREIFGPELRARAKAIGMNEREVLTLASIIEKEARLDEERPIISAVYHNRLRQHKPLEADPTAIYGIKPQSKGVSAGDVQRRTPYNTYHITGLPPGPIASPGRASIRAALYPADVKYLYFVSNNDGSHTFSTTHRQHKRAVRKYKRKMMGIKAEQ